MNKRILIATPLYPPEVGGPATYTAEAEKHFSERGIHVSVLPFSRVSHLPYIVRHIAYFFAVWRKMRRNDVVFAQDPLGVGLPAALAARLRGKRCVVRIAGDRAWETGVQKFGVAEKLDTFAAHWTKNPIIWMLKVGQRKTAWLAHGIIVPSNYFKQVVVSWGVPEKKVHAIYNGIDLERIPECASRVSFAKTIISAGRLVPWKGFAALITLLKELPEWRLLIAGDGPEKDNLQQTTHDLQLQDRVLFLGSLDRDALFKNMCEADVFVLNTSFESFSFQVVEAMRAGVPVVATAVCSLPELIVDGKEGFLVEPDDTEAIKKSLKRLENDEQLRANIIQEARNKSNVFSIQTTMDKTIEVLTSS